MHMFKPLNLNWKPARQSWYANVVCIQYQMHATRTGKVGTSLCLHSVLDARNKQKLFVQVDELEKALAEANKHLTRIDEADKRLATTTKPDAVAPYPEANPTPEPAAPAKQ